MLLPDGRPWLNPRTGKPTHKIGFTCAACHTGRLTYRETALLVDGGPALTDLGKFRQGLGLSILFTKYVPGRFDRFAMNVLGEDASEAQKSDLKAQLDALWDRLDAVRKLDKKVAAATVDEGYGRLDALNRIGNTVFALDLDDAAREANYAATTAPVNFPHVWNTSWFDWVQYNASIEQPMVRNAGEALGVSAPVNLTGPAKDLFTSQVHVENIARIEKQIAGEQPDAQAGFTGLRAPRWPSLFAEIDKANAIDLGRARKGAGLYGELCQGCHQAPIGRKEFWDSTAWLKPNAFGQRYLVVKPIPIATIGTDPAQAEDMIARTVALPDTLVRALKDRSGDGPGDVPLGEPDKDGRYAFGPALGVTVKRTVDRWYDSQTPPTAKADRERLNGYRPNGIQAPLAYKARPLDGVWATPPFLHNGAVPNVFALLSPVAERPKSFTLGRREFDPVCLGYQLTAVAAKDPKDCLNAEAGAEANRLGGLFTLDTAKRGNLNTGHEFAGTKGRASSGGRSRSTSAWRWSSSSRPTASTASIPTPPGPPPRRRGARPSTRPRAEGPPPPPRRPGRGGGFAAGDAAGVMPSTSSRSRGPRVRQGPVDRAGRVEGVDPAEILGEAGHAGVAPRQRVRPDGIGPMQQAVRRPGAALDRAGAGLAEPLVAPHRPVEVAGAVGGQPRGEGHGILDRGVGALPVVGQHGMRAVAHQHRPAAVPAPQGIGDELRLRPYPTPVEALAPLSLSESSLIGVCETSVSLSMFPSTLGHFKVRG